MFNVDGWRAFRQVALCGSFEGYMTFGLGVGARLPFRVFTLPGPGAHSRLLIDVAHHWDVTHDLTAPTSTAIQYGPLGDDRNADLVGIRTRATRRTTEWSSASAPPDGSALRRSLPRRRAQGKRRARQRAEPRRCAQLPRPGDPAPGAGAAEDGRGSPEPSQTAPSCSSRCATRPGSA